MAMSQQEEREKKQQHAEKVYTFRWTKPIEFSKHMCQSVLCYAYLFSVVFFFEGPHILANKSNAFN